MTTNDPTSSHYLPQMHNAYLVCALWTATNDDGDSIDGDYDSDDFSLESWNSSLEACETFINDNATYLVGMESSQAGHDFWLTRNHHGVGFWDRDLGAVGDRLTMAAHALGECDVVIGDDGLLHLEG